MCRSLVAPRVLRDHWSAASHGSGALQTGLGWRCTRGDCRYKEIFLKPQGEESVCRSMPRWRGWGRRGPCECFPVKAELLGRKGGL